MYFITVEKCYNKMMLDYCSFINTFLTSSMAAPMKRTGSLALAQIS